MGLKICIVHSHSNYSGVSSLVYTIAEHMSKVLNHDVHIVIKDQSNKEMMYFMEKVATVHQEWNDWADIYIFNYQSDARAYKEKSGKKIFVIHGLMEKEYLPPGYPIIDKVVCMSKRGFNYIDTEAKKVLANQPINADRFFPRKHIHDDLKNVLVLDSRNNAFYINKILAACSKLGMYCSILGDATFAQCHRFDVENAINSADLVIGYGRSVYESMLCGRAVIVYGVNGGDGYITAENFDFNAESNCSGWGDKSMMKPKDITVDRIISELKKYNSSHGSHNRELAQRFAVEKNIEHFLI